MAKAYTARDIEQLEGIDHVRRRPGMYIGGTDESGFHHLLWEVVDNAVDEAMNGHASRITVTLEADGRTVVVSDNGRGIPVDKHPKTGKSGLEVILTSLFSGAKFNNKQYAASGGLHGVGAAVVNALSEHLEATVKRDGARWTQTFRRGRSRGGIRKLGAARGSGTSIRFTPDAEVFGDQVFDPETILEHLEVSTFLNRGLRIHFEDEGSGAKHELHHEGGVADFLARMAEEAKATLTTDGVFTVTRDADPRLDVAVCWTDAPREKLRSFVNGIPTRQGGTHEQGLKDSIVKAVRSWLDVHDGALPRGIKPTAEDIREGVVAIGSIFVATPQFQGQTKDRLNNPEVRSQVEGIVRPALERWLLENPSQADAIVSRIVLAAKARMASREATTRVRRKSAVSRRLNLPGKLADCASSDAQKSELFIVEGDSAGGSAKQARDRHTQAVLPLRGKVLNAEQASLRKVVKNNELSDIVKALGCGLGKDLNPDRLRYHKVILLMDADSDGHHIATLLLAFFYRYLKPLIELGHVYLAQPPLYRIDAGKKTYWASDDRERARVLRRLPPRVKPEISRFKGLGEMMPKTLFQTTMDPESRRLLRVDIPDGAKLETEQVVSDLLGKDPKTRYREITRWMGIVEELDV
jgi:DNA gyrase subunit B/topoisomerase-4 subunit B